MGNQQRISVDPRVMTGLPCVRGTRVTVSNLVRQVSAGRTFQEIVDDYPQLTREDIEAALAFAAELAEGKTHELIAG